MVVYRNHNSDSELSRYIYNPKNYKRARRKQAILWCCIPRHGTSVYNALTGKKETTTEKAQYVISGTRGEKWVVANYDFHKHYCLEDGSSVSDEFLHDKWLEGMVD